MGSGKRLTLEEIGKIRALKEEGYSNREIGRRINRSVGVVGNFLKDPENYGKQQHGRTKRATSSSERRRILRIASNASKTSREIQQEAGTSASIRTVQRVLKSSPGLQRRRLKKKPQLTQRHKEKRLEFARTHMTWKNEWRDIIFSDEKRFTLDGPDGYAFYFHDLRKEEKFLVRRHSRAGGVMVWGAISYNGQIDLIFISGRHTSNDYIEVLRSAKLKIIEKMEGHHWTFQHDHAAVHTARVVKRWFEDEDIAVLDWPSLSPDLNIIENLWGWLTRRIYGSGKQFHTIEELKGAITTAWNEIPLEIIRNLYNSMENRIFEVINRNGGNTHY